MIYGVRTLLVAARRGDESTRPGGAYSRHQRSATSCLLLLGPTSSGRQRKIWLFVQGSLSHVFTLMLFEPTRRGQSLGRWSVDPVSAALLCAGLFVRSGLNDLLGRRKSERHADFINLVIPGFGGGLSSKSNALPRFSPMPLSQALVDTYFRFRSFYRTILVQFPIPAGNESDLPRCVFGLLPKGCLVLMVAHLSVRVNTVCHEW